MTSEYICPHCRKNYNKSGLCDYCKSQVLTIEDFNKIERNLNKGNESFHEFNANKALNFYQLAHNKLPNCDTIIYYKAICYDMLGDFEISMKECEKVLDINPHHLGGNVLKADHLFQEDHIDESLKILDNILDYDTNGEIHKRKMHFLINSSDLNNALEFIDEAIDKFPANHEFELDKELVNEDITNYQNTIDSIKEKYESNILDYDKLKEMYDFQKRDEFLDTGFRKKAKDLTDNDLLAITSLFYTSENYDKCLFYLNNMSENIEANIFKARIYLEKMEYDKCEKEINKIFEKSSEFEEGLLIKTKLIEERDSIEKALEYYNEVFENETKDSINLLIDLYAKNKKFDEVLHCIERIKELGYDNQSTEDQTDLDQSDEEEEIIELMNNIEEDLKNKDSVLTPPKIEIESEDHGIVDLIIDEYLKEDLECSFLILTHQNKEALKHIENKYKNDKKNPAYLTIKAFLLNETGAKKKALKIVNKTLKKDKTNLGLIDLKGQILIDLGRYPQAIEILEKGLELSPNEVAYLVKLSQLYFLAHEDIEKAIETIDRAIELNPENDYYELKELYLEAKENIGD